MHNDISDNQIKRSVKKRKNAMSIASKVQSLQNEKEDR